jgi:beta-glucosidase
MRHYRDKVVSVFVGPCRFRAELQNNKEIAPTRWLAPIRHFLGYSDPRNGWDPRNALIPDQRLQEFFRPSFQAAIDSG